LSNAIKFTDSGSVTLSVTCDTNYHPSRSQLARIHFEVEDTGTGIAEDQYDLIFAPFGQLKSNSKHDSGTGLGLPICQKILKLMNSGLFLDSRIERGSRFWFDLDLQKVSDQTLILKSNNLSKTIRTLNKPCKVLVVDDNVDNRAVLVEYLKVLGFSLQEARDGQEGIKIALEFQPDVILLDLIMPVMDGKEMLKVIAEKSQLQDTVIFMISANIKSITDSADLKCDGFLAKPVDLEQLLELLDQHLELDWQTIDKNSNSPIATQEIDNSQLILPPEETLIEILELVTDGQITNLAQRVNLLEKESVLKIMIEDKV